MKEILGALLRWLPKRPSAVLSFELPEQRDEFERAINATYWYLLVWDLVELELRDIEKYGREGYDSETAAKIREWIYNELGERGLRLDR